MLCALGNVEADMQMMAEIPILNWLQCAHVCDYYRIVIMLP
jgi:hypothetical protein